MIPGHQRQHLYLFRLEPAQVSVLDEVIRVFVMAHVADVDADVMQERGKLQPLALAVGEAMNRLRLIEQRYRETSDLPGMLGPVLAALSELDDAAPSDIGGSARPARSGPGCAGCSPT